MDLNEWIFIETEKPPEDQYIDLWVRDLSETHGKRIPNCKYKNKEFYRFVPLSGWLPIKHQIYVPLFWMKVKAPYGESYE